MTVLCKSFANFDLNRKMKVTTGQCQNS